MAYAKLSRAKNRDIQAGMFPLGYGSLISRFIAYQKLVHKYSKRTYHLNFYELIVLYIIRCINLEPDNDAVSMDDVSHYMGWNVQQRGKFYLERLLTEGWLINKHMQPVRTGQRYDLGLSIKCELALRDIERHCEVLLAAIPPEGGVKKSRKKVDSEKVKAKKMEIWEQIGHS